MSLERFTNKDDILSIDGVTRGIVWKKEDVELLSLDTKGVTPEGVSEVEVHVYSIDGGYINSVLLSDFTLRTNKLYVNYANALGTLGINRGEFELVTTIHEPVLGNFNDRILQVKEISPDRREILAALIPVTPDKVSEYETVVRDYLTEYSRVYDQDLAINFGKNNVFKVVNHKGWDTDNELVIRLYNALPDDILLNDTFWIVEELADAYIDNVNLTVPLPVDEVNYLKGANFDIDEGAAVITETEFKSWNDLLDANLSTSQQILDRMFSGSLSGVPLGIDYSAFDNFVFYSSAYERLANFKYKLELLEFYNDRITTLDAASGDDAGALANNVTNTRQRIDNIVGSFDGFERWLYNDPTSSLTTHGASGSYLGADGYVITPWPKYLSNGSYVIHDPSTTIASNWFATASANAILYDDLNVNALTKTIPEHIRVDPNNSQYDLFVNMIGHHFDILYSYIDALSRNYRNEEHPKLGVGKDTLYDIAKSMGWTLTNGNQATSLWKYKLGVDSGSGAYQSTGSLFSKSNEEITTEVWRRIVNNLPYLLKTKGTARSIKALMSCYGIPQTLLSIREYGGPAISGDAPNIIEDRYAYMLACGGATNTSINNGITYIGYTSPAGAITRELRFKIPSGSYFDMQLYECGAQTIGVEYFPSGLYSGSDQYGRVVMNGSINTPWVPIYDGDIWNVRWCRNSSGRGYVQVQKASDHFVGRISHRVSGSATGVSAFSAGSATIGDGFEGYIQEFREWSEELSQATFDDHTFSPTSYASSANVTGSYTTLQVHYTLGSDGNAYDHDANTTVSSSHPNRSYTSRNGTVPAATQPPDPQLGNYISVDEVYYIQGISFGGNLPRSQKIRLEDNYLVSKLSPTNTGERSSYDYAPIDNNKLGLFYSHADQVNKDIFDQFGDAELDEYMGDPGDEFETQYRDLRHISDKYWQKYTDRNDVNAYIRIFSQFDFSLFSQIKQLVPLRANLAAGVLVEPHALERAKVQITKRPQVENPQYDAEIPQPDALVFGEYTLYSGSIDTTRDIISVESLYHYGSYNGYTETGDTWFANFAGIQNPGPMDYCIIETNPLDEMPSFTASFTDLISANTNPDTYFDWYASNTTPNWTTLDTLLNEFNGNKILLLTTGTKGCWTYFSGAGDRTDTLCVIINNPSFDIDVDVNYRIGLGLYNAAGFNISSGTFLVRIGIGVIDSNGRLESIGNSANVNSSLSSGGFTTLTGTLQNIRIPYSAKRVALTLHFTCLSGGPGIGCIRIASGPNPWSIIFKVRDVCHSAEMPIIDQPRLSNIYQRIVYHYSGSYKGDSLERQNARHAYSQSLGLYYKREDVTAAYFDDELAQYENSRYVGCRISAPDINLPTTTENATAIAGTPVIEVYETNPNQLIFTQAPESRGGTGNTEPGNLLVR